MLFTKICSNVSSRRAADLHSSAVQCYYYTDRNCSMFPYVYILLVIAVAI
jgi:hypothetical protein